MKTVKALVPGGKEKQLKENLTSNERNELRQEYHTLMSNVLVNESSHNLKLMYHYDSETPFEFEETKNVKMKPSELLGKQEINKFNDTQLKIWDYILTKANFYLNAEDMQNECPINLAELCEFLNLDFQTKNIMKLTNDLKLMSKVKVSFNYKGSPAIGNLFEMNAFTGRTEIIIFLGIWINVIKQYKELQTYMFVNSKTYTNSKTKNGHDPYYLVGRKIHEIYKNNLKRRKEIIAKSGQYEITITSPVFIKCLLWTETSIKKNTKKFYNSLIKILKKIEDEQKINFDVIEPKTKGLNNYERFLKTKFIFYSESLEKEYIEKGYN